VLDLRRERFHSAVARWRGLSYAEPWGRWSDSARVELLFERPLPARVRIELLAAAIGDNARLPIGIQIGEAAADLRVSAEIALATEPAANAASADAPSAESPAPAASQPAQSPLRSYAVELHTSGRDRVLTLHVPRPTAPAQLVATASSDWRRLGLALARIEIRALPAEPARRR
jgi:hypothetical protein